MSTTEINTKTSSDKARIIHGSCETSVIKSKYIYMTNSWRSNVNQAAIAAAAAAAAAAAIAAAAAAPETAAAADLFDMNKLGLAWSRSTLRSIVEVLMH